MARARVKSASRQPFYLYVDEFQNFTNDTVANMMAESRKYGLLLTLANQNLGQLQASQGRQNVLEAVLGNVGNLISFRVGPMDAEKLCPYTKPEFNELDIQGLPKYHAIGRLLSSKGPTRPFVFKTMPPAETHDYACASPELWEHQAELFTTPTAEVEAQIIRRRSIHKAPKEVLPPKDTAEGEGTK
jgi:hypothetical protein